MKPPLIRDLVVTGPASLKLTWSTGEELPVDLAEKIDQSQAFAALKDFEFFSQATADDWGHGVEWPNGLEVGADMLFELSHAQANIFTPRAFDLWMNRLGLSNETASKLLGISRRTVINYRTGAKPISRMATLACVALADAKKPGQRATVQRGAMTARSAAMAKKVANSATPKKAGAKPKPSSKPGSLSPEERYKWVETRAYFIAESSSFTASPNGQGEKLAPKDLVVANSRK